MGPGSRTLIALLASGVAAAAGNRSIAVSLASRTMQPGELIVVTIEAPDVVAAPHVRDVRVRAFNRETQAFSSGAHQWKALVGIDLDAKPGHYSLTASVNDAAVVESVTVTAKTFRTRKLTVNPDFVTPPPSEAARIEQETQLLQRTYDASAPQRMWTTFSAPVPQPSNSAFGTRSIFNGTPRNAHGGADFLSPAGTPVAAPSAGRVVIARNLYFSGNTVIIDHGLGLFSMLAHLSSIDVAEGEAITATRVVGRVGATGRVTGPHLHWAVRVGGARVDPLAVLALLGQS